MRDTRPPDNLKLFDRQTGAKNYGELDRKRGSIQPVLGKRYLFGFLKMDIEFFLLQAKTMKILIINGLSRIKLLTKSQSSRVCFATKTQFSFLHALVSNMCLSMKHNHGCTMTRMTHTITI